MVETQHLAVSIHAPAKGATTLFKESADKVIVSIHAPAKGATFLYFIAHLYGNVSIHAPAKGATCPIVHPLLPVMCFNPRSREGSDIMQGRPRQNA